MIKNYLKIALRHLLQYKLYSILTVLGLAVGTSAALLIFFYVNFEKSYDKFHSDSNRIYRLRYERISENGEAARFASCCPPAALRIRDNFEEVEVTDIIPIEGDYLTYNFIDMKYGTFLVSDIVVHNSCFLPGTPINLANGSYKDIEEAEIGDSLKVFNEFSVVSG